MEAERGEAGGAELVDEFACAGMLRGSLTSLHGAVERIFGVAFDIGEREASPASDGQIWLKVRGRENGVRAAKLFVRGVVNQEEQQEVSYPAVLHCVFCGARGLFLDSLIRNTSAQILVGSVGYLLISGLAEPVVRAYSLIADLVEKYECGQPGGRGSSESLDSRRAFKALVERWEDRHILDLLVLPGAVKEVLLDLVRESGLGRNPGLPGNQRAASDGLLGVKRDSTTCRWDAGTAAGPNGDPAVGPSGSRGGAESTGGGPSPQDLGEQEQPEEEEEEEEEEEPGRQDDEDLQFFLLLKFFTAMGYTEKVVKRALARTGPKEASQILDLVQQEQDRNHPEEPAAQEPCESEHGGHQEPTAGGRSSEWTNGEMREGARGPRRADPQKEEEQEEDFVLGVLKKAAVSCGYAEQKVAEVYSTLPTRSTRHLLLELQREEKKDGPDPPREGPREIDDVVPEKGGPAEGGAREAEPSGPSGDGGPAERARLAAPERQQQQQQEAGESDWSDEADQFPLNRYAPRPNTLPEVKGPPTSTYPSGQDSLVAKASPSSSVVKQALPAHRASVPTGKDAPAPGAPPRWAAAAASASSVVVTGEQRFLEGLQTPFELQLTVAPGDPGLRTVVIDGSNVAMSHGLGHFFSCRGIALAVQHFWDRGHRHITALLPQWRQKSDSKTKEQHFLTELQRLGLLSYTPSREVQGRRISSYDDRFMLQHAQKSDGVIVTNDNLRDLLDDSPAWRDIIKKRLLQYTFVGDHFMVPDDPLGRGGPHLNDFLRLNHRDPHPGSHSFAGVASAVRSSRPPRSQTEVLHFRDRAAGTAEAASGQSWDRPRRAGAPAADRSLEETARLREQLCQVFAGQDNMVVLVLQCHPAERDVNLLSDLILEQQKD